VSELNFLQLKAGAVYEDYTGRLDGKTGRDWEETDVFSDVQRITLPSRCFGTLSSALTRRKSGYF
jgi:hypothetical protein